MVSLVVSFHQVDATSADILHIISPWRTTQIQIWDASADQNGREDFVLIQLLGMKNEGFIVDLYYNVSPAQCAAHIIPYGSYGNRPHFLDRMNLQLDAYAISFSHSTWTSYIYIYIFIYFHKPLGKPLNILWKTQIGGLYYAGTKAPTSSKPMKLCRSMQIA